MGEAEVDALVEAMSEGLKKVRTSSLQGGHKTSASED
jgi:hypothetical protein